MPKCSISHGCTDASLKPKPIDESNPQIHAHFRHNFSIFPQNLPSYCFHIFTIKKINQGFRTLAGITASQDSTGRDKATACPLKCASSTSTRFFFSQGREAARGSNDPAPVQDDADVNDVNELINEIEAQVVDDSTHREQRVEINDPVVD